MDTAVTWQPLGTHLIRVADDLLFLQVHGPIELRDLQGMIDVGKQLLSRYRYYISIVDATCGNTMTPAARRLNAQWMSDNPDSPGCSVVYGANMVTRVVITMINRATTLLSQRAPSAHFVADEAEALECAARERKRILAELAQRQPPR